MKTHILHTLLLSCVLATGLMYANNSHAGLFTSSACNGVRGGEYQEDCENALKLCSSVGYDHDGYCVKYFTGMEFTSDSYNACITRYSKNDWEGRRTIGCLVRQGIPRARLEADARSANCYSYNDIRNRLEDVKEVSFRRNRIQRLIDDLDIRFRGATCSRGRVAQTSSTTYTYYNGVLWAWDGRQWIEVNNYSRPQTPAYAPEQYGQYDPYEPYGNTNNSSYTSDRSYTDDNSNLQVRVRTSTRIRVNDQVYTYSNPSDTPTYDKGGAWQSPEEPTGEQYYEQRYAQ